MALDSYIVVPVSNKDYKVLRYKTMELMDIRTVSQVKDNPTDKRERIVRQFLKDGKPETRVYWIENGNIKSLRLTE
jgi:hypothetical protein